MPAPRAARLLKNLEPDLSPRQQRAAAIAFVVVFPILLGLSALFRVGEFVPIGAAVFAVIALWSAGNQRGGLIAALTLTLLIPEPLALELGPFKVGAGRAVVFAFIAGWLVSLSRADGPHLRRTAVDVPILAVLFAYVLSLTANSPQIDAILLSNAVQRVLVFFVDYFLFFFAAASVLGAGRKHLEAVLRAIALVVVFIAFVGLIERFTGRNVFTLLGPAFPGGFRQYVNALAEGGLEVRGGVQRVRATLVGPNQFGAVVVMAVPLMLHFSAVAVTKRATRLYLLGAGMCVFASLFTASRSVILGMVTVFAIYGVATARVKVTRQRVGAVVLLGVLALAFNPTVRTTMSVYFRGLASLEESSARGRVADYQNVYRQLETTPFAGSGPGTWDEVFLLQSDRIDASDPAQSIIDNTYLVVLAELGLVGFVAVLGLVLGAVAVAIRGVIRAPDDYERSLRAALLASVSWFFVGNLLFDMLAFRAVSQMYFVLLAATVLTAGATRAYLPPDISLPRILSRRPVPELDRSVLT